MKTQRKKIYQALIRGRKVSSIWGFQRGIVRLVARIAELKKTMEIQSRWVYRNGKKWKVYYMTPEEIAKHTGK